MQSAEIESLLAAHYAIGAAKEIKRIPRGSVNRSYAILAELGGSSRKYLLRRYHQGIREEEIRFEHAILRHLKQKNFPYSAGLVCSSAGSSYVQEKGEYYALFDFLEGEDRCDWDHPDLSPKELRSSARVLASYHAAVFDLRCEGARYLPKIMELLTSVPERIVKLASGRGTSDFDRYLRTRLDAILRHLEQTLDRFDRNTYGLLPQLAVHGDFHPGNLKFRDGEVVGLFDLDWTKIDTRCFDVALAISYFCTSWQANDDGTLLSAEAQMFLRAYQQESAELKQPGPLDSRELAAFPLLLRASNLYVLNWTITDYYSLTAASDEYLRYLVHGVRCLQWLETNQEQVAALARS
jgi:homoserine kinase type II